MRIVLDTNVLISAFVFPGGPPEHVYRLVAERRVGLIGSRALLAEFVRVLIEKFGWEPIHAEDAGGQVAHLADIVEPAEPIYDVHEDPTDNRVLEAALRGAADVIVSGDHHLLDLREWRGIAILDPAAFLKRSGFE